MKEINKRRTKDIKTNKITIVLPINQYISMDIECNKDKLTKSEWISQAVQEKLDKTKEEENYIEEIKEGILEIKELLKKK